MPAWLAKADKARQSPSKPVKGSRKQTSDTPTHPKTSRRKVTFRHLKREKADRNRFFSHARAGLKETPPIQRCPTGNSTATAEGADDDSITLPPLLRAGEVVTLTVNVNNSSGAVAYLAGWLDLNGDGVLANDLITAGGERLGATAVLPSMSHTQSHAFTFTLPATTPAAAVRGLRLRLSNQPNPPAAGFSGAGEIEDYVVEIAEGCGGAASRPTMEFFSGAGNPAGNGPSIAAQVIALQDNRNNPNDNAPSPAEPSISATFSLSNQQYSLPTSSMSTGTGVVFGGSESTRAAASATELFPAMNRVSLPSNSNFTAAPFGVPGSGMSITQNRAVSVFTSLQPLQLAGASTSGRYYYGDLTIAFSRPVSRPLLHVVGLGANIVSSGTRLGIATELELQTPGVLLTKVSGSQELVIANGTKILNGSTNPDFQTSVGAATGSVLVGGEAISSLTFKIFVRGDGGLSAWEQSGHAGDLWLVGVSNLASERDFGDHQSLGSASSLLDDTLKMGPRVDSDSGALVNPTATADDADCLDDEDGVALPTEWLQGTDQTMVVNVRNRTGDKSYLNAWVDFNGNGVLTDAGEQMATNVQVPQGAAFQNRDFDVNFTIPVTATTGAVAVRVRLTADAGAGPTGAYSTGEVEDYRVWIGSPLTVCPTVATLPRAAQGSMFSLQLNTAGGTAPYAYTLVSGSLPTGLTLSAGGLISGTPSSVQTRTFVVGVADARGLQATRSYTLEVLPAGGLLFVTKGNYNVPIIATKLLRAGVQEIVQTQDAGSNAQVVSSSLDPIEVIELTLNDEGVVKTLGVVNLGGGTVSNVTRPANSTNFGVTVDGVRHSIASLGMPTFQQWAAATSSNSNLQNYIHDDRSDILPDGAHEYDIRFNYAFGLDDFIIMSERFGNSTARLTPLDAFGNVIPGANALQIGPPYDWNTGYASSAGGLSGQPYHLTVMRASTFGVTQPIFGFRLDTHGADVKFFGMSESTFTDNPTTAALIGDTVWQDADEDGIHDPGEVGVAGVTVRLLRAGDAAVIQTQTTNEQGQYRFENVSPGDYQVEFVAPLGAELTARDVGGNDLVDSDADPLTGRTAVFTMLPCDSRSDIDAGLKTQVDYGDYAGFAPAGSAVLPGLQLGSLVDGEDGTQRNLTATSDDQSGVDDEDGVFLPSRLVIGQAATVQTVVSNSSALMAYLHAWVDYNGDGQLTTDERIANAVSVPPGTTNATRPINFVVSNRAQPGVVGVRVRLTTAANPGPTGLDGTGEVEDNTILIACPGIELTPENAPVATETVPYEMPLTVIGGSGPYVYGVQSGALPTWATLDSFSGQISGTPDSLDPAEFTIVVVDSNGCLAEQRYSIVPVPASSLAIGNLVFKDLNEDGRFTLGEGVSGVNLELYHSNQTPGVDLPVKTTTTDVDGLYLFDELDDGTYIVHIPASEFAASEPLDGQASIQEGLSGDDDVGEDGINVGNPVVDGVSSGVVSIGLGQAPTDLTGETGFNAASDNNGDAAVDLTVDFGFQTPVGVGNLVFIDANSNRVYDAGEGVAGVQVELYRADQVIGSDLPIFATTTDSLGRYGFLHLSGGLYRLNIPASEFQFGEPLEGMLSIAGATAAGDDDVGENGIDDLSPSFNGIRTAVFALTDNGQATAATGETGGFNGDDSADDDNFDLTIDFGFAAPQPLEVGVGNLVFVDFNGSGTHDFDEGVDDVVVQIFNATDDPQTVVPLAETVTRDGGFYIFAGLVAGDYKVHLPAVNFQPGGPLLGMLSLLGAGGDFGADDDWDENGIDAVAPETTGVTSGNFNLTPDTEPTDFFGEFGEGFFQDSIDDDNFDLTIDFGFATQVGVGNLVYIDANGNGQADVGEGVPGVEVQLFMAGQSSFFDAPVRVMDTGAEGEFLFDFLSPGFYFLYIPNTEFQSGAPLFGMVGLGGTVPGDDHLGEDGVDTGSLVFDGIESAMFELIAGAAPTGVAEGGYAGSSDDDRDADIDLTRDFGFAEQGALGNAVFFDRNGDGLWDPDGDDNVASTLDDEIGLGDVEIQLWSAGADDEIGGGDDVQFGDAVISSFDGSYGFAAVPPGRYYLRIPASNFEPFGPLANYPHSSDVTELTDNNVDGDDNGDQPGGPATEVVSPLILISAGETDDSIDFGFVDVVSPLSWQAWQVRHPAGLRGNGALENLDGDLLTNVEEFAFGQAGMSGLEAEAPLRLVVDQTTGRVDVVMIRVTGITGVRYVLEGLTDLTLSPEGWQDLSPAPPTVVFRADGTEEVTFADVGSLAELSDEEGYVRVRVELDEDLNGTPEVVVRTEVLGWARRTMRTRTETMGVAFAQWPVFSGVVGSTLANGVDVAASLEPGEAVETRLQPGLEYYLEVTAGDLMGHRYEVDEANSGGSTWALDLGHVRSTRATLPASLAQDQVVVRAHATLGGVFAANRHRGTFNPSTADQMLFYDRIAQKFETFWVFAHPAGAYWVKSGDAALESRNALVLEPLAGWFTLCRGGEVAVTVSGHVKAHGLACPLLAGVQVVTPGWPVAVSPEGALMDEVNGFTSGTSASSSDQLLTWEGDGLATTTGYKTYFLLGVSTFRQWILVGDGNVQNQNATLLLQPHRGGLVRSRQGLPTWLMPRAWTP